ncbi:MAG TPA: sulfolactaldehyde 3-reductase, partial [Atlantibacter hermannii]|nr:sulfolactaldehyde 3-reductase [Atlantibacter hermannii]
MTVIAFLGLGQMGLPMASNLVKQGYALRVFDVNPQAVSQMVGQGAVAAQTPAQAAEGA